jgi:molybdopterin synthase catalytic subunit
MFEGVTRNHNDGRNVLYLEYEAYRPMADKKIAELIAEMQSEYEIDRVAVGHRTGRVGIGETSLVVAVSSAHRKAAFDSALYFVDRLKEVVPIWKKEFFEGGEVWINDTPPE